MSRVGRKPVTLPKGVKVNIGEDKVHVEGPKGKLDVALPKSVKVEMQDGTLVATRENDDKNVRALHGLVRALVQNAVTGVTTGFQVELDVVGIGYKAEVRGRNLSLSLGFSHPLEIGLPDEISVKVERLPRTNLQNYIGTLTISGIDRYKVGQFAADVRAIRPPDAYRGKGIRYSNEQIKLKVGKKGA